MYLSLESSCSMFYVLCPISYVLTSFYLNNAPFILISSNKNGCDFLRFLITFDLMETLITFIFVFVFCFVCFCFVIFVLLAYERQHLIFLFLFLFLFIYSFYLFLIEVMFVQPLPLVIL